MRYVYFGSVLGLVLSIILHLCSLANIAPPRLFVTALNIGFVVLLSSRLFISKKLAKGMDKKEFKKITQNAFPNCLYQVIGVFVIYGVFMCIWYVVKAYNLAKDGGGTSVFVLNQMYKGFSAVIMSMYFIEFSLLYSYKRLDRLGITKNSDETHLS
jgi:hypothetical protein